MRLVVATTNPGKIREINDILARRAGSRVELVSLRDFPTIVEPEETGATFAENARLKALYYSEATGLPSVADDSGLEIDALDNAPGVHSARWHGTDYAVKFRKIYELLRKAQPIQRLGTPEEIGRAVMFLLSDECAYMTGALLSVDGGYTCQ